MKKAVVLGLAACHMFFLSAVGAPSQVPSETLESILAQARQLEQKEDYAGAEKVYQHALSSFPDRPEVFKRLGILYQTELKFPESIDLFQKLLRAAPGYPEVNFYLGLSYFGLNQHDKALKAFDDELMNEHTLFEASGKGKDARQFLQGAEEVGLLFEALQVMLPHELDGEQNIRQVGRPLFERSY